MIDTKKSLLNSSNNDTLSRIDSLITYYYGYLNSLDLQSEKLNKNIFYEKNVLQEEGEVFKNKSEIFLSEINTLINNEQLKKYLYQNFNLDDVKNENDLYFLYMEYYYLDIPYSTFKFLIKKRKYDLMMFQNEVLNNYLIEKVNKVDL